jgi:beta-lactamase regulating signal transducer with metallopeptidase domain
MIAYILKSSLSLIILFGLYWFLLRREKLFIFNRYFLIFSILFSLVIPLISIPVNIQTNENQRNIITLLNDNLPTFSSEHNPINDISKQQYTTSDPLIEALPPVINFSKILLVVYLFGLILSLFRFTKNILNISRQIQLSESTNFSGKKLVLMDHQINPYCFFSTIFVCKHDYLNNKIAKEFLTHELEHIRQSHSIDIIILELVRIVYWFNPILFLYSRAIRVNHEYLADTGVLRDSLDIRNYTDKLLSLISHRGTMPLTSGFNHSLMKKRLIMITKTKAKNIYSSLKIALTFTMAIFFFFVISCKPSMKQPVRMSFIPQGQFTLSSVIGSDTIIKTVSVGAFSMSNEITNKEFREFTDWAKTNAFDTIYKAEYARIVIIDNNSGRRKDTMIVKLNPIKISDILQDLIDSTALHKHDSKYKDYFTKKKYDDYPVVGVSKKIAEYYCIWKTDSENKMREEQGLPKNHSYRLPLEMEWEYVAQQPIDKTNASIKTSTIQKSDAGNLNIWGLTHFENNVSEWVTSSNETNGIVRGGSWKTDANIAERQELNSSSEEGYIGFRIVQSYISPYQAQNVVPSKIPGSRTLNIILGPDDRIYWYPGNVQEEDIHNLPPVREISYGPDGIRQMLLDRNMTLARKINAFNNDIHTGKIIIPKDSVQKVISSMRSTDTTGPIVLIKAYEGAKYRNFIDIQDEMNICGIGQYMFVEITWYEEEMVKKAIAVSKSIAASQD